ncbi:MAG: ABC transporter ATP-binding protein [Armatimonadota bacterium]|nr:ABC transporter ATP-binding protein [bacterium]MDW8320418.1 ABC transporter ATP-binding protein [Armatimonadota bacterium]
MQPLIEMREVRVHFPLQRGEVVHAVDGVNLTLTQGEAVGLVGESGCGKSTLARALLRLIPLTAGEVWFDGKPLHQIPEGQLRPLRKQMQIVFQDPMASLNPRLRIGHILVEPLEVHGLARGKQAWQQAGELLERVGLPSEYLHRYPHEFSGGQRQRICIARAIATQPRLLVADEPTSALDLSIRAQIHALLSALQRELHMAILFVTHDLHAVRQVCSRVLVMYLGKVVESAPVERLFTAPAHPYTCALLDAVLEPKPSQARRPRNLPAGDVPTAVRVPTGCRFHTRCPYAQQRCEVEEPSLQTTEAGHEVACHYPLSSGNTKTA